MAQVEVKVKLDLPPGAELLGYERSGDGHGFEDFGKFWRTYDNWKTGILN